MGTLNIPTIGASGTTEQQVAQLKQQVYNLTEQLRYAMESIDPGNFSGAYRQRVESIERLASDLIAAGLIEAVSEGGELSPDTLQARYKRLREEIVKNAYEINQVFNAALEVAQSVIIAKVTEEYAAKSAVAELRSNIESRIEQTSSDVTMKFSAAHDYSVSVEGMLTDFQELMETYIRFDGNGVFIGKLGSPFTAQFSGTELGFYQNNVQIAYFANNKLFVTAVDTEKVTVGVSGQGYVDIYVESGGLVGAWRD